MSTVDGLSLLFESLSVYCGSWRNLFAGIGLLSVGKWCFGTLYYVFRDLNIHFLGARNVRYRLGQYGQWAVVTGCTSGIGREFSLLLASYGLDMILIARDETRLNELADFLETEYGVQTTRVVVDFSHGAVIYDSIKASLVGKDIGILINNVGIMYEYPEYFFNVSEKRLWDIVTVNVGAAQAMTHAVLNASMIKRGKGLIVALSSLSVYQPTPLFSAYQATKAYEEKLFRNLYHECLPFGVHFQTLIPGFVATNMTSFHASVGQKSIWSPSPSTYVKHASWTLGRAAISTGYLPHSVILWFAKILPEWCWITTTTRMNLYFRQQYLDTHRDKAD